MSIDDLARKINKLRCMLITYYGIPYRTESRPKLGEYWLIWSVDIDELGPLKEVIEIEYNFGVKKKLPNRKELLLMNLYYKEALNSQKVREYLRSVKTN